MARVPVQTDKANQDEVHHVVFFSRKRRALLTSRMPMTIARRPPRTEAGRRCG